MRSFWEEARAGFAVESRVLKYRPLDWFLLKGNRLVVSAGLLAVVALLLWGTVLSGVAPLARRTPILFLLFALISANFTLITIVVSLNQFVLARHLETPGEVREQLGKLVDYRESVGGTAGEAVLPVTPGGFFLVLFGALDRELGTLLAHEWVGGESGEHGTLGPLLEELHEHTKWVVEVIEGSDIGVRYALFAALSSDYSRVFYEAQRLQVDDAEAVPGAVQESLDELTTTLEHLDVARRYFKTVFIQSELASLSRLLLYVGVPLQVITVALMLLFTATGVGVLTPPVMKLVIPAVVTVGFVPIVLLTTFMLRLATVVRRTAAMYPFSNG